LAISVEDGMHDDPATGRAQPPPVFRSATEADHAAVAAALQSWWTMPGFDTEAAARERAALVPRLWLQHFAGTSWIVERGGQLEGFLIAFLSPDRADEGYIHFVGVAPIGGARASDGSCTSASSSAAATPAGSGSVASRRRGIPARSRSIKRWGSNWSGPATRS
jgi:hypothetical protein